MEIDGKTLADGIMGRLKEQPAPKKFLAAVLVGKDFASVNFLKIKENVAGKLGVDFRLYKFPPEIKNDALRKEVRKIALHKTCGGVIVQLPLPEQLSAQYILNAIPPEKDVEVLGERALGAFYVGRGLILPPAVGVVDEILKAKSYNLQAASVAVVGLGRLVGKPIAVWLIRQAQNLYLLRRGSDFSILKKADLVVTGAGVPGLIQLEMLKDGAGVIDFGYSSDQRPATSDKEETGKLRGDFNAASPAMSRVALNFYTPAPGGTGPILVAKIFENFYKLNQE